MGFAFTLRAALDRTATNINNLNSNYGEAETPFRPVAPVGAELVAGAVRRIGTRSEPGYEVVAVQPGYPAGASQFHPLSITLYGSSSN